MNLSTSDSDSVQSANAQNLSTQKPSCPICAAKADSAFQVTLTGPDTEYVPAADNPFAELQFHGCRYCGFAWGLPYVDAESLARFYEAVYYQKVKHRSSDQYSKFNGFFPLDPRSASQVLLARMFKAFREGESFLDIGAGSGRSFRALSQLIPGLKYFAFEPDGDLSSLLQRYLGVHVFAHQFPSEPTASSIVEGRRFDLVLMSHVLEHFNGRDVSAVLKNVRDLVSEDGIFVCEVPYCDWREHEEVIGHDPAHLSLFSRESLRLALVEAGFEVKFLNTCGEQFESWLSGVKKQESPEASKKRRAGSSVKALGKSIYHSIPIALPGRMVEHLYSLISPNQSADLLLSDDFSYGGDRTCLRALATVA